MEKKITVTEAIKRTRKEVKKHLDWDVRINAWVQVIKPAGMDAVQWRKARRVAYAADLLGYDRNKAYEFAFQPGNWEELLHAFIRS